MTDKATPRPWRKDLMDICGPTDREGDDVVIGCVGHSYGLRNGPYSLARNSAEDNAELIVRAVNSHDDLVAALDAMVAEYGSVGQVGRNAEAALAKAKEGDR